MHNECPGPWCAAKHIPGYDVLHVTRMTGWRLWWQLVKNWFRA
jgi:hypothetical protein